MTEWSWLDERDALALHGRSLLAHGGGSGLRDPGLLDSALARPRQLAVYGQDLDVIGLAAAYTAGLVQNHPFVDGNKRTGFLLGVLFLEINGLRFVADEAAAAQAVLDLAAGTSDEAAYVAFLRAHVPGYRQP